MDILILYPEIMPYNLPVWRIIRDKGYSIRVIQLGSKKLTPFQYNGEQWIEVRDISEWSDYQSFKKDNYDVQVKLLFVSEVMNPWYWRLARNYRTRIKNLPIVLGSDAQWTGKRNNYIKKLFFYVSYKQVFTHVLSAGLWQVVYALKIGFKRNQILTPLYCANCGLYYGVDIERKKDTYPKRFIFVGRMTAVKGVKEIVCAWDRIKDKHGWKLTMIGSGDLNGFVGSHKDIEMYSFMDQKDIVNIMQNSGCALVPSLYEPWGLVIHEATAAGLPVIVSKNCGATNQFVKNGVNGYYVDEGDVQSLMLAMKNIVNKSSTELITMSEKSREFSKSIQPECVSSSLLSLIK